MDIKDIIIITLTLRSSCDCPGYDCRGPSANGRIIPGSRPLNGLSLDAIWPSIL